MCDRRPFNRQPRLVRLQGAPGSAGLRNGKNWTFRGRFCHRELKLANHEFIAEWAHVSGSVRGEIVDLAFSALKR